MSTQKSHKSAVWEHYNLDRATQEASCKYCQAKFVHKKSSGTSSLINHAKTHGKMENEKGEKIAPEKLAYIKECYVKFVLKSNQPFSISDNEYFKKFVTSLNPNYTLMCSKTLKLSIEDSFASKKEEMIEEFSNLQNKYSISCDIWTSVSSEQYLALDIHFVDDYILKKYVICFERIADQSAHTIANVISRILNEYKLDPSKLLSMTTDNAKSMIAAKEILSRQLNQPILTCRCIAHIINLIVKNNLLQSKLITDARSLALSIKSSPKTKNALKSKVSPNNKKFVTVKIDVPTRWNSTYIMINSIIENEEIITGTDDIDVFTKNDWARLKTLGTILKPFYDLTTAASTSEYPLVGMLYTIIEAIKTTVKNVSAYDKKMSQGMIQTCDKYFSNIDDKFYISMVLDPRNKLSRILDPREKEKVRQIFIKEYQFYKKLYPNINQQKEEKQNPDDIMALLFPTNTVIDELEHYLASPVSPQTKGNAILDWWKLNQNTYAVLAEMAKDYFSISVSTVSVESLFSQAGEVITDRRNRLSNSVVQQIMCLRSWL